MSKRALIVDDSSTMRMMLRRLLEKNGFAVAGVSVNGVDAVKLYQELKPDFVTLDMIMPRQNGLETLKQLKQIDPNATVIMISSLSAKDRLTECAASGAKDYILKPFNEENVMTVLRKVLGESNRQSGPIVNAG
jgi:two-component system, chemotaxis family, chemotaxis protein CheY